MLIEQISIFVENKLGRLSKIAEVLHNNDIDIRAMSIADTKDFGILRLIVNNPKKAEEALKKHEYTVSLTKVIAAGIPDKPGGMLIMMKSLFESQISVEYMYAFLSRMDETAYVILRVEDNETAVEVLKKNGVKVLSSEEIYEM